MAYTDEQIDALVASAIDLFANGDSLRRAALKLDVSRSTLNAWLLDEKYVGQYTRARIIRADYHADEIQDIKHDCISGLVPPDVARVAIDASKWQASKMDKERYGDKQTTEITGKDGGAVDMTWTITHVTAETK